MGHEIVVAQKDDLVDKDGMYGCWMQTRNQIIVQTPNDDHSESFMLQTFWHEAIHAALDILGYEELSEDEEFVDRLGQAIHQILRTKRSR